MFNTKFSLYGVIILVALLSNVIVVVPLLKKYSYDYREILGILLYQLVGIIGGAKLLSFLQNYQQYNGEFNFVKVGLSAYGGVIGAIIFILLFSFQFKKSLKELLYIFMPSIPLMYSIGKVGCFLAGCCYGIEYNGIFKVAYHYSMSAPKDIYLFPIQIVESIVFFVIFVYIISKHKKNQFNLKTLGKGFVFCSISKFLLDFFRMSHKNMFLSTNQIISVFFTIIGLILLIYADSKRNNC